ncbi:hypothetical protein GCM10011612_09320 [Actinomyces gaoshouyii]|uniref:Uncharacterized protein n=1 Tax=Actinomyces gaoshouyii TaxID=1960083 RepID=A0A8H9LFV7_9ACTO|nr:hypothetical protein GCM10011612_09320 [Actinomyces gaoshouyii]
MKAFDIVCSTCRSYVLSARAPESGRDGRRRDGEARDAAGTGPGATGAPWFDMTWPSGGCWHPPCGP